MSVKISELPEQTTSIPDESFFPMIDDNPYTKKVNWASMVFQINTIPYSQFNNGSNEITLENWGLWEASDDCGDLFNVNMPFSGTYPGKILILFNRTTIDIPIVGLYGFDGPLSTLGAQSSYICFSNGLEWIAIK